MPGRNDPCPCGSGAKYKKCCSDKDQAALARARSLPAAPSIGAALAAHQAGRLPEAMAIYRAILERARALIAREGLSSDLGGLRSLRSRIARGALPELAELSLTADFHCASEWRDLAFHVHESSFDLIEIQAMLDRQGLAFIRFSAPPRHRAQFDALFPGRELDLAAWDEFEQIHPDAFMGMYQFHAQKIA